MSKINILRSWDKKYVYTYTYKCSKEVCQVCKANSFVLSQKSGKSGCQTRVRQTITMTIFTCVWSCCFLWFSDRSYMYSRPLRAGPQHHIKCQPQDEEQDRWGDDHHEIQMRSSGVRGGKSGRGLGTSTAISRNQLFYSSTFSSKGTHEFGRDPSLQLYRRFCFVARWRKATEFGHRRFRHDGCMGEERLLLHSSVPSGGAAARLQGCEW